MDSACISAAALISQMYVFTAAPASQSDPREDRPTARSQHSDSDDLPPPLNPEKDQPGLKVGEKAPNARIINEDGEKIELASLYKAGPVIVTFYRGKW